MTTDGDFVEQLEDECEEALRDVVEENFENLDPHVVHLMAKAAVTVLEAALDREDLMDGEAANEPEDEDSTDVDIVVDADLDVDVVANTDADAES